MVWFRLKSTSNTTPLSGTERKLQQCNLEVRVVGKMAYRIAVANPSLPFYPFALH